MDPHSPTGARGGCKRAGATGTRRLCEAPGGPSFSEKSRTDSPRWLAGLNRGRGPRWCPRPSFRPLLEATQGEEAWGEWRWRQTWGQGNSSTDTRTQEEIRVWGKERGLEAQREEGQGLRALGTLRQGLRIERAEARGKGGLLWKHVVGGNSKGHTYSPLG